MSNILKILAVLAVCSPAWALPHNTPDFAANPTKTSFAGAGPDDVVLIEGNQTLAGGSDALRTTLLDAVAYLEELIAKVTIPELVQQIESLIDMLQALADSQGSDEPTVVKVVGVKGTLTVTSKLKVKDLLVYPGGKLILEPSAEIIFRDLTADDPEQFGTGLLMYGTLEAHRAVFTSENPSGTRGHVLITGPFQIDQCHFVDVGRTLVEKLSATNLIGRYAVHVHLLGEAAGSSFTNNLIYDTILPSKWRHGISIHGTHGVTVSGNFIYHKAGSGIYLEDGTERANVIENNTIEDIVAATGRSDSRGMGDLGFEGCGIWLRGPDSYVRNNTVRRCAFGYMYFQMYAPTIAHTTPVREFSGNVAEDCNKGLEYWWIGGYYGTQATGQSTFDITARNCQWGVYGYQGGDVRITGTIENCTFGFDGGDYLQRRLSIADATITGCDIGILPSTVTHEPMLIDNCALANDVDVQMRTLYHSNSGANCPPRRVELNNCQLNGTIKAKMFYFPNGTANVVQRDQLFIGSQQVFYLEQRPDFIVPQTANNGRFVGCPVAGLTNEQAWAAHSVAIAGAVAPADAVEQPGVIGLVK